MIAVDCVIVLILVKCRWCHAEVGHVEKGAAYDLKCPNKCRPRVVGVA